MSRGFANGLGELGSIPGRVIPKTQKMVLDAALLNTQHYKVKIKGKVEQSKERSSALSNTWLRWNINIGVYANASGADVSLRDVTIARDGKRGYTVQMTEARGGFGEILKKSVSWDETCLGGRRLVFAFSRRPLWRVTHVLGVCEKAGIERLCLSLLMSKNL